MGGAGMNVDKDGMRCRLRQTAIISMFFMPLIKG